MKLYWSSRSPYVRKVMITAHEAGISDQIETISIVVSAYRINPDILALNPLGKIPTLVRDDGPPLFDSRVICEYLDARRQARSPALFPLEGEPKIRALRWQALGDGVLDLLLLRLGEERTRPPASRLDKLSDAIRAKLDAALDALEVEATSLSAAPFSIGHVAIGGALSYLDFRFGGDAWRNGRKQLASWHEIFENRPSVKATAHIDA